jgi:hypothetical protein
LDHLIFNRMAELTNSAVKGFSSGSNMRGLQPPKYAARRHLPQPQGRRIRATHLSGRVKPAKAFIGAPVIF